MISKIYFTLLLLALSVSLIFSQSQKLAFIQNKGQWDKEVKYKTDFPGGQALVTSTGMVVGLFDPASVKARVDWGNKIEDREHDWMYTQDCPKEPPM